MMLYTYCYELTYTSKRIRNVVSDTNVISLNYNLKTHYLKDFLDISVFSEFFSRELITKVSTPGIDIV